MKEWKQVCGDIDPFAYGATIARESDDGNIELIEIQPVIEYIGRREAAEVGFPFWTKVAEYTRQDLDPESTEVQDALRCCGREDAEYPTPTEIAVALFRYGYMTDEGPRGFSGDLGIDYDAVDWWTDIGMADATEADAGFIEDIEKFKCC